MSIQVLQCCVLAIVIFTLTSGSPRHKQITSIRKKTLQTEKKVLRDDDNNHSSKDLSEDGDDNNGADYYGLHIGYETDNNDEKNGVDESVVDVKEDNDDGADDINIVDYKNRADNVQTFNIHIQVDDDNNNDDRVNLKQHEFNADDQAYNHGKSSESAFHLSEAEIIKHKLWRNAIIPYYIDVLSFYDKILRDKIREFLSSVQDLTSLKFVELPNPPDDDSRWVLFINRRALLGCADHSVRNFTNSGVQQVVLGYHCMSTEGELAEAVLAIAGVPAQHTSPDRDNYVQVNYENIIPEKQYLFRRLLDSEWLFKDLEYDYNSAGHFRSYKHTVNGHATIEPQFDENEIIPAIELSTLDIKKIRMLYDFMVESRHLEPVDCYKLFDLVNSPNGVRFDKNIYDQLDQYKEEEINEMDNELNNYDQSGQQYESSTLQYHLPMVPLQFRPVGSVNMG